MFMCSRCKEKFETSESWETFDGTLLCEECAQIFNFCEICASIADDTNPDTQLHYEEECFK